MKSVISILLISCLIFPLVGTYCFWEHERHLVRKSVKRRLIAGVESSELVLLKFSKEETQTKLRWKHSKEFEFNGQMYDIVETSFQDDSIFYRCWWDHAETALNKKLDKLLAEAWGHAPVKKDSSEKLVSFLKSPYLISQFQGITDLEAHQVDIKSAFQFFLQEEWFFCIPSPPPEKG